MGDFYVGTSGFASPVMRPGVRAQSGAATDLLAAYARRFGSVELDSVFYRSPAAMTVEAWREATGEAFRFAVRVPREITHVDRLALPQNTAGFVSSLHALGPRLGSLLFTTPPTFGCDVERFRAVLDMLPPGLRTAWEFRHPSWMCPQILELLAARNSAAVIVEAFDEMPGKDLLPQGTLAERWELPFVYVRFRRDSYTYADLVVWGDILGDVLGQGQDVYAFFRQSPEATSYATALAELLAEARAATFSSDKLIPEPARRATP